MSFHLTFERDKCKGCELCISVCPKGILGLDSAANLKGYSPAYCKEPESCIGCASCAKICPDSIITIMKDE